MFSEKLYSSQCRCIWRSRMICAYNLNMPEDFQCPSCKVVIARSSQDTHGLLKPQRQSCPYCGSRLDYSSSRESRRPSLTDQADLRRSSSAMRRSASAHLPALIQSRPAAADTVSLSASTRSTTEQTSLATTTIKTKDKGFKFRISNKPKYKAKTT